MGLALPVGGGPGARAAVGQCGPASGPVGKGRLGQVEIGPFKRARANQGPARPPRSNAHPGLPLGPGAANQTRARGKEIAARVTGEQHRRSGYRCSGAPWSAPCTASRWAAGAPAPPCPSTSPPSVSDRGPAGPLRGSGRETFPGPFRLPRTGSGHPGTTRGTTRCRPTGAWCCWWNLVMLEFRMCGPRRVKSIWLHIIWG